MREMTEREKMDIASSFVVSLVEGIMSSFHMTYTQASNLLKKSHYWEKLNDLDMAVMSAHYGTDYILEELRGYL